MIFSDQQLQQFEETGCLVVDDFLTEDEVSLSVDLLSSLRKEAQMKRAGIGKGSQFQINDEQRGDYIFWLHPQGDRSVERLYFDRMEEVRMALNRSFFFGIQSLEAHLALYPKGGFYKKHSDQHHTGSRRVVSSVLYLNTNWESAYGGHLIIDLEDGSTRTIEPKGGRMVLFLSHLLHEVQTTLEDRMSITGWLLR
jgi:SM-20-related protein